ncbi:tetratricopeptide repeat protein [Flavobacterium hiemivividum]|uniref:Tetratricopeptide repeat protein n=1 Tax=Flavobacterium hiemivividum TaxID=2541734 RepID=A0A4R5CVL5_9FLAO|nr:tetratricopeptide repeat protein [Flavobacterium hiemivividum]TDE04486.1 tetratricopeptide repeat protein [Flavobacterium hiemivividum]
MKNIVILFLFLPMMIWSQSNFEKAEKLFKAEKYDQAQPIFEALLKTNPSNIEVIEYLGDIAGSRKSWEQAIDYYEKLKNLKPSEADYFYKYGGATGMRALEVNKFKALGMIDDIRTSFEKAIQLDPKHVDARWALVELNIQLPRIVGGSEGKAIRYSNELLKLSPVDGYMSRARIEEYYKRYKAAEIQYKKAIEIGNSAKSYQKLAELYKNKMNDPERARITLAEYKKRSQEIN